VEVVEFPKAWDWNWPSVWVSFPLPQQNTWDNQLVKRKGLLWLTVCKVSAHGQADSLFLGLWWGSTSCHGAFGGKNCSPHGGWEAKWAPEEGEESHPTLQGHVPGGPYNFLHLSIVPSWELNLQHMSLLGDISDPNYHAQCHFWLIILVKTSNKLRSYSKEKGTTPGRFESFGTTSVAKCACVSQ
jgi:hypothetical protein